MNKKLFNLSDVENATHPEDASWCAVWAYSEARAKDLARSPNADADSKWFIRGSHDLPEFEPSESGIETRDHVLRRIYWRCECDSTCDTCGLAEMDGQFPVCPECGQCCECGCTCQYDEQNVAALKAAAKPADAEDRGDA